LSQLTICRQAPEKGPIKLMRGWNRGIQGCILKLLYLYCTDKSKH